MRASLQQALRGALLAGLFAPAAAMAQLACGPTTVIGNPDDITLSFKVCGDQFIGTATAKGTGWAAVGFSTDQYMPGTDVFMAGVLSDGTPYGSDRFAYFRSPPVLDGQQDASLSSASESNGFTSFTFSRPLSTGDAMDYDLTVGNYHILLAYNEISDSLTDRHTFADPSDIAYTFAPVPVPEPSGALMAVAGLVLLGARLAKRSRTTQG